MLNLAGEKDDPKRYKQQLILIIAWLTGALRGGGPYAVLNLQGEQGTAKSTTTRMLRGFVDPNEAPIRAQPQKEDELILAANNGLVLAFDNVSHIEPWLSDALCRLCTGGGFSKRQLYTDDDEVLFNVKRPLIVNGIDEVIGRSDLLDRTIPIELAKIPPDKRQLERAIWTRYADLQPVVLGLLLDGVAMALRRQDSMVFTELPRMADFAAFAAAAAPAYGWQDADVLEALEMSRKDTNASAIEASPVGRALISMMSVQNEWTGTAAHLLGQLGTYAKHNEHKLPSWPQSPRGLSGSLRRLALNLRAEGLEIIFSKSGNRSIHVRHTK
jgi:hypothetical protein